ncbi:MAG: hypothetical protein Q9227_009192 [Pyrenula ochraceoflavens]
MHSAVRRSVCISLRSAPRRPRLANNIRRPVSARRFHRSPPDYEAPNQENGGVPNARTFQSETNNESEEAQSSGAPKFGNGQAATVNDPHGSASRRALRNKAHQESQPFFTPPWFVNWNIQSYDYNEVSPWTEGLLVVNQDDTSSTGVTAVYPPPLDPYIQEVIEQTLEESQELRDVFKTYQDEVAHSINVANDIGDRLKHMSIEQLEEKFNSAAKKEASESPDSIRFQALRILSQRVFQGTNLHDEVSTLEKRMVAPQFWDGAERASQYLISSATFKDIFNLYCGLMDPPNRAHALDPAVQKSQLRLHFVGEGGHYFLHNLVQSIAGLVEADILVFDPQDIAEIMESWFSNAGEYSKAARLMSYDILRHHRPPINLSSARRNDDEESMDAASGQYEQMSMPVAIRIPVELPERFGQLLKNMLDPSSGSVISSKPDQSRTSSLRPDQPLMRGKEETRWTSAIEGIFDAVQAVHHRCGPDSDSTLPPKLRDMQRKYRLKWLSGMNIEGESALTPNQDESPDTTEDSSRPRLIPENPDSWVRNLRVLKKFYGTRQMPQSEGSRVQIPDKSNKPMIIHVQDIEAIQRHPSGARFLRCLHDQVQLLRIRGKSVVVIGTSEGRSSDGAISRLSNNFLPVDDLQSNDSFIAHSVNVVPISVEGVDNNFFNDEVRRTVEVNLRHIAIMLKVKTGFEPEDAEKKYGSWPRRSANFISKLGSRYLTFDEVHHVTMLLSSTWFVPDGEITFDHVVKAVEVMGESQSATAIPGQNDQDTEDQDRNRSKKRYDEYEQKLLSGVIEPDKIRTTFSHVHAPHETIDALQTLTALSIKRPDAFSYGVLATDKISGLLLYGPPGTGKTLLAKAVAKESGARVLQVSGAEIWDMYVGEAEKNIRALFSLAKKLAPLIIFIDEADAIFGSRSSEMGSQRSTHRQVVNQFLKEWDGVSNDAAGGAFIMVATNRPFDLDDAVLRRLPRRVLVDLPQEKDRLAILRLHLQGELLAEDVNLSEVAAKTPFYSGSDLKNVCVSAALTCVKEENQVAAQHTDTEKPYEHAQRRTLTAKHFEKALEEVSASISEDMNSLKAIKKFDEQYGDNRKNRKKAPSWGFRTPKEENAKRETVKVRA